MSINAQDTIKAARELKTAMDTAGHPVSLKDCFTMVRVAQKAARMVIADEAKARREDRIRKGMVANAIADLRACGAWDGE